MTQTIRPTGNTPAPRNEPKRDTAVRDSFPASDPPANPFAQNTRAVPVHHMSRPEAPEPDDAATISAPFADVGAARLALEALVREIPIPREHIALLDDEGDVRLSLRISRGDEERISGLLSRETRNA